MYRPSDGCRPAALVILVEWGSDYGEPEKPHAATDCARPPIRVYRRLSAPDVLNELSDQRVAKMDSSTGSCSGFQTICQCAGQRGGQRSGASRLSAGLRSPVDLQADLGQAGAGPSSPIELSFTAQGRGALSSLPRRCTTNWPIPISQRLARPFR
jgi:hypothetical protein